MTRKTLSKVSGRSPVRSGAVEGYQTNGPATVAGTPDVSNLDALVEDARRAALNGDPGPADPTDFHNLRGRVQTARLKMPPLYRETFVDPFIAILDDLGPAGLATILVNNPNLALLLMDCAHAILQNAEGFEPRATDGFQEVVSDLYDGFLGAEDRVGVNPPDVGTIPPLVKWGNPDFGPYTWPGDATFNLGIGAGVVSLPPANARAGLLAWSALGHETGGHDILHADTGLEGELTNAVRSALAPLGNIWASYWGDRIDESASDVLGILNMGPTAAIGLVGYFRGLNAAFAGDPRLRNTGPANDFHPADILRGYLGAETVRLLSFDGAAAWADLIAAETDKDLGTIRLLGQVVDTDEAKRSCQIVAETLATTRVQSLENHSLIDIQDWRNLDEEKVATVREALTTVANLPDDTGSPIYAAHIVAAAVTGALAPGADVPMIFERMLVLLKRMHDQNPAWGPLFIRHRGDISPHPTYLRYRRLPGDGMYATAPASLANFPK